MNIIVKQIINRLTKENKRLLSCLQAKDSFSLKSRYLNQYAQINQ